MEASSFLNPLLAVRASGIHEGMTVADFGSGSGFFARAAAHMVGAGGRVYAVDAHRDMLMRMKSIASLEGFHNIAIVAGDVERKCGSHLSDHSTDFVIAANILFSAENHEAIIEEMWRVLKKNGRALVIDWKNSFGGLGPHPSHIVDEKKAKELFHRGGFEVVKDVPAGAYHWGLVVRKTSS